MAHRRPPTLCAHRLREPNRTSDTSDALCRTTSPRLTGSNPRLPGTRRGPPRTSLCSGRPKGPCRTRCTELAACLGRRASCAPERLPSVRSGSRDPVDEVALVVHSRALASHPVARFEPGPPRQRLAGRFELSLSAHRFTSSPLGSPVLRLAQEKDASLRLLQPTLDTRTRFAARFPISILQSSPVSRPDSALGSRVEPRLTAILQLRLPCNPRGVSPGRSPVPRLLRASRRSGRASIDRPSAPCLPFTACSAAPEHADPPLTLPLPTPASVSLSVDLSHVVRPFRACRLVKDDHRFQTRAPSLDRCLLAHPSPAPCLRRAQPISRGRRRPATVSRLGRAWPRFASLCLQGPASDVVFTSVTSRGRAPLRSRS